MTSDHDRPRGMLTKKDRRYLCDDKLPESRQAQYERKKGARQRIQNGIIDFEAALQLPQDERQKILENEDTFRGLRAMIAFSYRGFLDLDMTESAIENVFEIAINRVERQRDLPPLTEVDVSIDVTRQPFDLDKLEERFDDKEYLTDREIMQLFWDGRINSEQLENYVEEIEETGTTATELVEESTDGPD